MRRPRPTQVREKRAQGVPALGGAELVRIKARGGAGGVRLGAEVRGQRCGWGRLASGRVMGHGTWLLGELKSTSEVQNLM